MSAKQITYEKARELMQPGDVIAFGGHGPVYNEEGFSKFFCSELVSAGLEAAGAVGSVNASEVPPIDLCRWNIYEESYYQIEREVQQADSSF